MKVSSNPQPDVLSVDEMMEPPERLNEYAAEYWNRYIQAAHDLGIINQMDWPVFETLCMVSGAKDRIYEEWRDAPVIDEGRNGEAVKSHVWTEFKQAAQLQRKYLSELGFTPTSREKLDLSDQDEIDPMEEAFG